MQCRLYEDMHARGSFLHCAYVSLREAFCRMPVDQLESVSHSHDRRDSTSIAGKLQEGTGAKQSRHESVNRLCQ
jgi:hypothetical protein